MNNSDLPRDVRSEEPSPEASEERSASPHDTLVYKILSDPVLAAAELKVVLPQEVVDEIDWDNLEQDTNRFVAGNLDNHFTDLLFKTTLRRRPIRIRLLLEHSSHLKPYELLQTLQYQLRHWEREALQKKEVGANAQRLTPILTIILHHSPGGWRGKTRFIDYFGLDEDLERLLRPHVVDFGIFLDDVSKVNTDALVGRPVPPEVQIMLFALRYARLGRRVLDELPKMAPAVTILLGDPNGRLVLGLVFLYMKRVAKVSEAEMRTALDDLIEPHLDPEMVALWTQFEAGEKKGRLEGKLEGKLEGLQWTLRGLLEQRFGTLSPNQVARLDSASLSDLEAMIRRVFTATTVDEVLG